MVVFANSCRHLCVCGWENEVGGCWCDMQYLRACTDSERIYIILSIIELFECTRSWRNWLLKKKIVSLYWTRGRESLYLSISLGASSRKQATSEPRSRWKRVPTAIISGMPVAKLVGVAYSSTTYSIWDPSLNFWFWLTNQPTTAWLFVVIIWALSQLNVVRASVHDRQSTRKPTSWWGCANKRDYTRLRWPHLDHIFEGAEQNFPKHYEPNGFRCPKPSAFILQISYREKAILENDQKSANYRDLWSTGSSRLRHFRSRATSW